MSPSPIPEEDGDPEATVSGDSIENRGDGVDSDQTVADPRFCQESTDPDQTVAGCIDPEATTAAILDSDEDVDATIDADVDQSIEQQWQDTFTSETTPELTLKCDLKQTAADTFEFSLKSREVSKEGATPIQNPDYVRDKMLGEGGMGAVYAARQKSIERDVAIKVLKGRAARRESSRDAFVAEAMITGELDHPNIVPVYDLGLEDADTPFYVMKQVQGVEWADRIRENSVRENLDILIRVANAIALAHARGIIHRDLKPANIMLGEFGEVLVMDWGLAVPAPDSPKRNSYPKARFGGTPCYMAPEMANGPVENVDRRSDIYLLGAILFQILTGTTPHPKKRVKECLRAAAENEIAPTEESGLLMSIAMKAMSTSPDDRHQTVGDFEAALKEYFTHLESISLAEHGAEDLKQARISDSYEDYARTVFAFEQAYELWPGNEAARTGLSAAKLSYAESALAKGEHDLCGSVLDINDPAHQELQLELFGEVAEKRRLDEEQARRLKRIQQISYGLIATVAVTVVIAFVWINSARSHAELALATAETEKDRADLKAAEAELQRIRANESASRATIRKREAEDLLTQVQVEKQATEAQAEINRRQLYYAQMTSSGLSAESDGAIGLIRDQLENWLPEPARADLRGWEWRFLSAQTHRALQSIELSGPGFCVDWSPDRNHVAVGTLAAVTIYDVTTGATIRQLQGHDHLVMAVQWDRMGDRLASASYDGMVIVWDDPLGEASNTSLPAQKRQVTSLSWSRDNRILAALVEREGIVLWEPEMQKEPRFFSEAQGINLQFNPKSELLACGVGGDVQLWNVPDVASASLTRTLTGQDSYIHSVT